MMSTVLNWAFWKLIPWKSSTFLFPHVHLKHTPSPQKHIATSTLYSYLDAKSQIFFPGHQLKLPRSEFKQSFVCPLRKEQTLLYRFNSTTVTTAKDGSPAWNRQPCASSSHKLSIEWGGTAGHCRLVRKGTVCHLPSHPSEISFQLEELVLIRHQEPVSSSGGLLCSFSILSMTTLESKRLLKSHYARKGGWSLPFTFHPQAILLNISTVAVWESSTISICYTFLPSAGKTINWMCRTELLKLISQSIVKKLIFSHSPSAKPS